MTIHFENVTHRYGAATVLDAVTVTLAEPRIAVIGANGSGKSTLARMVNGLVTPSEGRVLVDGLDPARQGREVRRHVGFVFTDPDTQIVMPTVAEDVAFSLRRSGLTKAEVAERTAEMLHTVGLSNHADHPAHLLSGGQKQLLAIGAVLVRRPRLVIADEPTTLLDLRNSRRIAELLLSLPQQVVIVTHDLPLAARTDRVLVIDEGRIVADAAPDVAIAAYRELVEV